MGDSGQAKIENALEILVLLLSRTKGTEVTWTGSTTNCSKWEACKEIQSIQSKLTNVNLASYCTQVHKHSHSTGDREKGKKILANANSCPFKLVHAAKD